MATTPLREDLLPQFQMFNQAPPGAMSPRAPDQNAPMPYGQQMGNVGGAIMDGLGAALNFIFNKPGGGGLLDPSRTAASGTPGAPAAPVAPAASAAPAGTGGVQFAPDAAAPASNVAKAMAKPRGTAATGAATPAVPPEGPPPGMFYMNDTQVPFGQMQTLRGSQLSGPVGGGMPGAPGAPGGGLIDPRSYFPDVVGQQLSYARKAAEEILKLAGNGGELGFGSKMRALAAVYNNGLAGVGQGGANSFNSSAASMFNTEEQTDAQRYVSNNSLTGDLARSSASLAGAQLGYKTNERQNDLKEYELTTSTVPMGTELATDPVTKMAVPTTTYGQRPAKAGAMPTPYNMNKPKFTPGQEYTDKAGNRAVYQQDGSWKPVK